MADKQKVIAVTVIHRTLEPGKPADKAKGVSATRPKMQVIQPKTVFMTRDKDEFDELMEAGAIRLPEKGEKIEVDIENAVVGDGDGDDTTTKKTTKATSTGKSGKATKGTESGTTKTSANAGTTTSGSQAGEGGDGDGNDLV